MGTALVAGVHQQFGVGAHKGGGHGHLATVGQCRLRATGKFFDGAKDVIPTTGVETSRSGRVVRREFLPSPAQREWSR